MLISLLLSQSGNVEFTSPLPWIHRISIEVYRVCSVVGYTGCMFLLLNLPWFVLAKYHRWQLLSLRMTLLGNGLLLLLLLADALIFRLYYFHLSMDLLTLLIANPNQMLGLSTAEWWLGAVILLLVIWLEGISLTLAKQIKTQLQPNVSCIVMAFAIAWLFSSLMYLLAQTQSYSQSLRHLRNHAIVAIARTLVGYNQFYQPILDRASTSTDLIWESLYNQPKRNQRPLHYPKRPLLFGASPLKPNIIWIVIDSWRADQLNKKVTPHLFQFCKSCDRFLHHYSGGNATYPGLFSLFYGIPANFRSSMIAAKQPPLLWQALTQQHYAISIFTSASNHAPPLQESIFMGLTDVADGMPGNSPGQRDQQVVIQWQKFLNQRASKQPFFSFLFFDAAHSYCANPTIVGPFQPQVSKCNRALLQQKSFSTLYFNRYKNNLHQVDERIGEVLAALQKNKLLDNTIIIVTSDHGESFNDLKQNDWGHANNFSSIQTQVPLLIHWPKISSGKSVHHRTSHYDIIPTLLARVFGIKNAPEDYSFGSDIWRLSAKKDDFLFFASYFSMALTDHDKIYVLLPSKGWQIYQRNNYRLAENQSVSVHIKMQWLSLLNHFYDRNITPRG